MKANVRVIIEVNGKLFSVREKEFNINKDNKRRYYEMTMFLTDISEDFSTSSITEMIEFAELDAELKK